MESQQRVHIECDDTHDPNPSPPPPPLPPPPPPPPPPPLPPPPPPTTSLPRPDLLEDKALTLPAVVATFQPEISASLAVRVGAKGFPLVPDLFGPVVVLPRALVGGGTPDQVHFVDGRTAVHSASV